MASARRIPQATVSRLPLYLRVLGEAALETGTISSEMLAARAGVNAAQVRKDLSYLGSYGTRGVGYEVGYLVREINRRLGLDADRRVAIVGAGNLGQALASYGGFPARGFHVVAAFDADPAKVGGLVGGAVVQPSAVMLEVLVDKGVDIAIITTPASAAQAVADTLIAAGVACILNFAPVSLSVPDHVILRQVDLGIEMQILSFYQHRVAARA
ncbi:MAG: redox-sensing transcriptional repressor Rex [Acidimicrobiales bacterium]|nr:redox-sensing transcriptional repressor Rex [Acidimicrobiales bacterium]